MTRSVGLHKSAGSVVRGLLGGRPGPRPMLVSKHGLVHLLFFCVCGNAFADGVGGGGRGKGDRARWRGTWGEGWRLMDPGSTASGHDVLTDALGSAMELDPPGTQ